MQRSYPIERMMELIRSTGIIGLGDELVVILNPVKSTGLEQPYHNSVIFCGL